MVTSNNDSKPIPSNNPRVIPQPSCCTAASSPVAPADASVAAMEIAYNHKTYVRIDKPLSKFNPAVAKLFYKFHNQLSAWRAATLADLQCEAHSKGVTYMVRNGSKAFIWINFIADGLSIMVPGVDTAVYPGSKPTTNTPDQVPGALLKVTEPAHISLAVKAIQDGYKARI
jgi:hypothetical protein